MGIEREWVHRTRNLSALSYRFAVRTDDVSVGRQIDAVEIDRGDIHLCRRQSLKSRRLGQSCSLDIVVGNTLARVIHDGQF